MSSSADSVVARSCFAKFVFIFFSPSDQPGRTRAQQRDNPLLRQIDRLRKKVRRALACTLSTDCSTVCFHRRRLIAIVNNDSGRKPRARFEVGAEPRAEMRFVESVFCEA